MHFNITWLVPPNEETSLIWRQLKRLLLDLVEQLRGCELAVEATPDGLITNTVLESIEHYVKGHREHPSFGDRQSLLAEYRRVINLGRIALGETYLAGRAYADQLVGRDDTDAASRLRQKLGFHAILGTLTKPKQSHPKVAKLIEVASGLTGSKTLVVCTTKVGASELAAQLLPYAGPDRVFSLHGGALSFERQFKAFDAASTGVAVATATHQRKLGLIVGQVLHYNLVSADLGYVSQFVPIPVRANLLVALDNPLDLGRGHCRPTDRPRVVATVPPRRRRKHEDTLTLPLPFGGGG